MGNYDGEAATYEAFAGALQASPYMPDENARLKGLRLIIGGEAATSLVNNVQIKITSNSFQPNTISIAGSGNGLRTAPAVGPCVFDFEVDQPVLAGVQITFEGRHGTGSPVTSNVLVMGLFDNGK
jgi:hypothetical protein